MSNICFAAAVSFIEKKRFNTALTPRQVGMFVGLAGVVLLVFAYFYFQEWLVNRRMRQLTEMARMRQARAQATAQPPSPRLPLIRLRGPKRASAPQPPRAAETPSPSLTATSPAETADASKRGRLEICAEDTACEVFVDGAFIGNAPARLTIPEGQHVVEVKHPSGRGYRRTIFVSEAAEQRVQAVLESRWQKASA